MLGKDLVPTLDLYLSVNREAITQKLSYFENFRMREDLLRDYYSKLGEFDKVQAEADLSRFKGQFERIKNDLEDFNPMYIDLEINKIDQYMRLIETIKEEYNNISSQMKTIENSWLKFKERNEIINGTFFEESFLKLYKETWEIIEETPAENMSSVSFAVANLSKELNKTIELIEKINIYLNLYVYIGDEAKDVKGFLENLLNIEEIKDKATFVKKAEHVFKRIEDVINESKYGTVGIEVIKVKSTADIEKYSLEFCDYIVDYDPFFNNEGLIKEKTGEYIYFDNFPNKGIFKGREIVESLDISYNYQKSLLDIKEKMTQNFKIGLLGLLGFSSFGIFLESTMFNIFSLLLILGFFALQPMLLKHYKKKYEKQYSFHNIFLFTRIDFIYVVFGKYIDIQLLLNRMIEKFSKTILCEDKEGKFKWIKKYQLAKNL